MANHDIRLAIKRIYEAPEPTDGIRVLVDRLWARGVSKEAADLGAWMKELGPTDELRTWFGHDPERFDEFARRYRAELRQPAQAAAVEHLREVAQMRPVILLTATKRVDISQAAVLADVLREPAQ